MAAPKVLKSALELAPDFPMALIVRGYVMSMLESVVVRPKMLASVEAGARGAAERCKQGTTCMPMRWNVLLVGDINGACMNWENILAEHPHDLLALKMHHHTAFWTGRAYAIRNTVTGVFDAWDESIPGYSFVLAMMCFCV